MSSTPTHSDPYDALPYVSMPITYSQPALLAAQARLRGIEAPAAETARVLEIGAASGGNIIPLAARFPKAQFHGVDLAATHIATGQRRIAELELTNITLEQGDITEADFGGQRFDYIICHGVFSWAPRAAQQAILKVCGETLTDTGIAAISYNVFPGWHARNVIRDICLQHTRHGGTPREKVEAVRELLGSIAAVSSEKNPYGAIVRAEAARLQTRPASYILGELLAVYNDPLHVSDVIARSAEHGLAYLAEADLMSSEPEHFMPAAARQIHASAGGDPVAVQQYIDIFSGRPFRRSLFVRTTARPQAPSSAQLASLHVTGSGRTRRVRHETDAVANEVVDMLEMYYPASVAAVDLFREVLRGRSNDVPRALLDVVARGEASISTLPTRFSAAEQTHPRMWRVARSDAATGQPWVTSQLHAPVLVSPLLRALAPLMDGRTSRQQLAAAVLAGLQSGAVQEKDLAGEGQADIAVRVVQTIDRVVEYCVRNALLV